jgi:hypothetical protein
MLIIFGECGRNAREAATVFSDRFPHHKTILKVLARAQETGQVLPNWNEIGVGARSKRTLDNEEAILNIVEEDGTRSIREIAQEIGTSRKFVLIVADYTMTTFIKLIDIILNLSFLTDISSRVIVFL